MKLHQLLRFIQSANPICIFDITGINVCQVKSKEKIPTDLYEYDILELAVGITGTVLGKISCFYITIQK